MTRVWMYVCCIAFTVACAAADRYPPTKVAVQGVTVANASLTDFHVKVRLLTREIQIGKPSDPRPEVPTSSCTYSRYPCSVIDSLELFVESQRVPVPRSAFSDLGDVTQIEVLGGKKGGILALYGGGASEAYVATIEFDRNGVNRRTVASTLAPAQPLQETVYHAVVIGD